MSVLLKMRTVKGQSGTNHIVSRQKPVSHLFFDNLNELIFSFYENYKTQG